MTLSPEHLTPEAYARSILRRRVDAEDAVQQAALRGLERLPSYDVHQPFRGWWFTILRHCCIDLCRSRRPSAALSQATEPLARQPDREAWLDLADALQRLDPHQAEILRLRYFAGLNYAELGRTLNIPQGTVMSRLHYARQALAEEMKEVNP